MTLDRAISEICRGQFGLVTLDQLRTAGLSRNAIAHRVRAGRLEVLEPRLYRLGGTPETWEQRVLGACLSAGNGAAACRRTAAALWGLWRPENRPVEIVVPRPRNPQWGSARVFRSTDVVRAHRTEVDGVPVTTVPRTLVDLGAVAAPWLVDEAIDRAIGRGLVSVRELEAMLRSVARQGRRGVGAMRRSLDDVVDGVESVLEAKLVRLVLSSGLPRPEVQFRVALGLNDTARIDLAYPEIKLAIEADGREAHISKEQFQRERDRQNRLENMGWGFLRYTWFDVTKRPAWVVATISDRRQRLLRRAS